VHRGWPSGGWGETLTILGVTLDEPLMDQYKPYVGGGNRPHIPMIQHIIYSNRVASILKPD
jgi:hypothetical protein